MCMDRVEQSNPPRSRRPVETVLRWKVIRYYRADTFGSMYTSNAKKTGVWCVATYRSKGRLTTRTHIKGASGWHVYTRRKDAKDHIDFCRSDPRYRLVKVEVAHLLDKGIGDGGWNNEARVETYQWIRVPRRPGK